MGEMIVMRCPGELDDLEFERERSGGVGERRMREEDVRESVEKENGLEQGMGDENERGIESGRRDGEGVGIEEREEIERCLWGSEDDGEWRHVELDEDDSEDDCERNMIGEKLRRRQSGVRGIREGEERVEDRRDEESETGLLRGDE
ncbi:hypothetical protein Tco_0489761 [Tanacetum coccineum]